MRLSLDDATTWNKKHIRSKRVICCSKKSRWNFPDDEKPNLFFSLGLCNKAFFFSISSVLCNYIDIIEVLIEKTRVMFNNYREAKFLGTIFRFLSHKISFLELSIKFCFVLESRLESFFADADAINHVKSDQ